MSSILPVELFSVPNLVLQSLFAFDFFNEWPHLIINLVKTSGHENL